MSKSQKLIAICPECKHEKIYNGTALRPRITCSECKTRFYVTTQKTQTESKEKQKSIPPQDTTQEALRFIDNPDELLLSTAIRELNKPNPDPRWATILINCKKEKITTKTEVIEEFRQQPTQLIVNLLNKSSQKEP